MDQVFFEEKQKLPVILRWIVVFTGLALCFPFMQGMYVRSIFHEPLGEASMSNMELMILPSIVALIAGLMAWLVSSMYLEIKIDQSGIFYRFFPHQIKTKRIDKKTIADFMIRKLRWIELVQSKHAGKFRQSEKNQILRLSGTMALELRMPGDLKIILGTQNPEGLRWAMKKLMSNS